MARRQNRRNRKNRKPAPGVDYRRIRAGLIARATNVAEWSRANGIRPSTAYDALRGRRTGIESTDIVRRAMEFMR